MKIYTIWVGNTQLLESHIYIDKNTAQKDLYDLQEIVAIPPTIEQCTSPDSYEKYIDMLWEKFDNEYSLIYSVKEFNLIT